MNNKRQTIWLVSMLSLMVILSAYYLFTEDAKPTDNASGIEQTQTQTDAQQADAANPDGVSVTEVDQITGEALDTGATGTEDGASPSASEEASAEEDAGGITPEDEAVLKGMNNLHGMQLLDQYELTRKEGMDKEFSELNNIISDTKNYTQQESADAWEKMSRLEELSERIASLEDKLSVNYEHAVVSEEGANNFKVIVLSSNKLEKKQAVGIVDMAIKELAVTPDQISVQVVQ